MFGKLKRAYESLVGAIYDHAATIRQADTKFRQFYGLDEDSDAKALPAVAVVEPAAPPAPTLPQPEQAPQPDEGQPMPTGRPRRNRAA